VAQDANKTQVKAGGGEAVQGEGGGSSHRDLGRQAAPPRKIRRLSLGLEEGVREAEGRARKCPSSRRSNHADQEIQTHNPDRRFHDVVSREDITKQTPGEIAGGSPRSGPAAATAPAASPRASSAAAHKQAYRVIDFKRDKPGFRPWWRRSNTIPTVRRASRC
jgi:hypothetical protein